MVIDKQEWNMMIHEYIARALQKAHDAKSSSWTNYWKWIAHQLKGELQ